MIVLESTLELVTVGAAGYVEEITGDVKVQFTRAEIDGYCHDNEEDLTDHDCVLRLLEDDDILQKLRRPDSMDIVVTKWRVVDVVNSLAILEVAEFEEMM